MLTALMDRPERLIYLSSGLHLQARPDLKAIVAGGIGYSESKFYLVLLAKAVARLWPAVYANAVNPGWVPTKMGGPHAPDRLEDGVATQVWLASSEDPQVRTTGRYFHHLREAPYHRQADDAKLQDAFLEVCAQVTGVVFPGAE